MQQLFHICKQDGLLVETDGKYLHVKTNNKIKDESVPFVVIEGLDGTGKTFLLIHNYLNFCIVRENITCRKDSGKISHVCLANSPKNFITFP